MLWPVAAYLTFTLALLFATSCASGPSKEYSHAGDLVTEWPVGAELTLRDHLGSGVAIVDGNGADRFQRSYHPYGSTRSEFVADLGAAAGQADHYVGNERDVGADLGHFHARPYDYQVGRFLGPDPLRLFPSWGDDASTAYLAAYSYTAGNPIRLLDPSGQKPHDHFASPADAASDFAKTYNDDSIRVGREYGSSIYTKVVGGKRVFSYNVPNVGGTKGINFPSGLPEGSKRVTSVHTHGRYKDPNGDRPSKLDYKEALDRGEKESYIATPSGRLQQTNNIDKLYTEIEVGLPADSSDPRAWGPLIPSQPDQVENWQELQEFGAWQRGLLDAEFDEVNFVEGAE